MKKFSQASVQFCEKQSATQDCRTTISSNNMKRWMDGYLWHCLSSLDSVTTSCPGPLTTKQVEIITPPPQCLTVGIRKFMFICFIYSTLVLSVQRTLFFQNTCDLFRCNVTNLSPAFVLSCQAILVQSFCYFTVVNFST